MNAAIEHGASDLTQAITSLCAAIDVAAGAAGLARELSRIDDGLSFREVLSRGGWYRPGGVVDGHGRRIAPDVVSWAEEALVEQGDDLHALLDAHRESDFCATRFIGRTHYLVAPYGSGPIDFIQVEIEELQEQVSHRLFDIADLATLEELYDRPAASGASMQPLGQPRYVLRRVTDVARFLGFMQGQKPEKESVQRFVDAWQASSAATVTQFSNHWVFALREYRGAYGQTNRQASPVAALNGSPPRFNGAYGVRGLLLNDVLQQFDRAVGYPMAWFFHLLTTKAVPHAVAQAVMDDAHDGFSYLPERDVKVLDVWLRRPYGF